MNFIARHLAECKLIIDLIDQSAIEKVIAIIESTRVHNGRIFFLGVGGSAANCSHAVNDFRKILGIESYAPSDNASELTARTNDEGWSSVFVEWLKVSRLNHNDCIFVLSVGGGNVEQNLSTNIVEALKFAQSTGCSITGIVGRDGGFTAQVAHACLIVPTVNPETVTPHTEAFQAVIWHLIVSHPRLKIHQTRWESSLL